MSIEAWNCGVSIGSLFVSRTNVGKIRNDVTEIGELIDELLFAPKRQDPAFIELSALMEFLDILTYDKNFFLILDPTKGCNWEDSLNLLGINKVVEDKMRW